MPRGRALTTGWRALQPFHRDLTQGELLRFRKCEPQATHANLGHPILRNQFDPAVEALDGLDQVVHVAESLQNYLNIGLVALAGSCPKFWRIVMLWSDQNVRLPDVPNATGVALIT